MPGTFSASDAVELAVVERDGFAESRHAGSAIVVDASGDVIRSLGDPASAVLGRSCLKPFQAMAILGAGAKLVDESLVIATASHAATNAQVSLVATILAAAGLTPDALQCPAAWPADGEARIEAIRSGSGRQRIFMNCSGQHAAMLSACVLNGWPTQTYLDASHPLQVQILDTLERMTGERMQAQAVDGCGAPVAAFSLAGLARAVQRMATASASSPFALYRHAAAVREAVLAHGWMIDGPGRASSTVIDRLGVFVKTGVEGVVIMAARDGTSLAVKVLDGGSRAAIPVGLALLADAGSFDRSDVDALLADLAGRAGPRAGVIRPALPPL